MSGVLSQDETERLTHLKERFRKIVNDRWGRSLEQRSEMLSFAVHDFELFVHGLKIRHGLKALPTVVEINQFLTDKGHGAPRLIDIAMRPRPQEERLPFTPAESLKRQCVEAAGRMLHNAIYHP